MFLWETPTVEDRSQLILVCGDGRTAVWQAPKLFASFYFLRFLGVNFLYFKHLEVYWWLCHTILIQKCNRKPLLRVHKLFDKIPKWYSVIILEVLILIYKEHLELITYLYANAIEDLNYIYTSCLIKFSKWCFVPIWSQYFLFDGELTWLFFSCWICPDTQGCIKKIKIKLSTKHPRVSNTPSLPKIGLRQK